MNMPAQKSWLSNAGIYQVFTGRWESANIQDHKGGVFNKLSKLPFESLKSVGIDTIYLLGVFDNRGPIIVENEEGVDLSKQSNRYPSPFAISDHRNTNPDLGSIEDLKSLIINLQKKGFKVILDYVANHTSTVHPWVESHPEYYTASPSFVKEFSGDVYKLNFNNQDLRAEMLEVLKTIISWGVDGVRCDMAHLVPLDFWEHAIKDIKGSRPNTIFIAEAYSKSIFDFSVATDHIRAGFDGVYHQALYENFKKVYSDNQPKSYLKDHISYTNSKPELNNYLVNYLSNHDDLSPTSNPKDLLEASNFLLSCKGTTLLYNGTLNQFKRRIGHHYIDVLPDKYNEVFHIPDMFTSKPKKSIKLRKALGIDVGGTKIASAIVDENGNIIEKNRNQLPSEKHSYQIIDSIVEQINTYLLKGHEFEGVGISLPGYTSESGDVLFAGKILKDLVGVNIPNEIKSKINKNLNIIIENDANCFALAEAVFGAGKDKKVVLGVIWGSGVGLGIVVDKNIIRGEIGGAGEFGHIVLDPNSTSKELCGCGQVGCLEMLASGKSIERKYKELGGTIQDATVKDIYQSNEKVAKKVVSEAVSYLGLGISYLINIINPGVIVMGGGVSLLPDEVYKKLEKEINKHTLNSLTKDLKLVRHEISDDAGMVGAAALVI